MSNSAGWGSTAAATDSSAGLQHTNHTTTDRVTASDFCLYSCTVRLLACISCMLPFTTHSTWDPNITHSSLRRVSTKYSTSQGCCCRCCFYFIFINQVPKTAELISTTLVLLFWTSGRQRKERTNFCCINSLFLHLEKTQSINSFVFFSPKKSRERFDVRTRVSIMDYQVWNPFTLLIREHSPDPCAAGHY